MRSGLIRDCIFPWSDVCVGTEINFVGWQQMDCALSHCLTKAFPSFCAVQTGKVVFIFSERMDVVSVPHVCLQTPLPKMHNAPFLLTHMCTLPLTFVLYFFWCNLCLDLKSIAISHILSYRGILYKADLCMHVVVRTIMWPLNSSLWYMYVNISSVEHCSPLRLLAYAE